MRRTTWRGRVRTELGLVETSRPPTTSEEAAAQAWLDRAAARGNPASVEIYRPGWGAGHVAMVIAALAIACYGLVRYVRQAIEASRALGWIP